MRPVTGRRTALFTTVAASALLLAPPLHAQDAGTPAASTLLQRIVVGTGVEKVAIDTPQAVTVLDQAAIDEQQPETIGDLFREIPGVSIVGSDSVLGESINIRGIGEALAGDEKRIIIQVDGVNKFFEQYRMGSFFSDPELYKQVEVLRGPASSTLYGAGAMGGVVTFQTKDASDFLDPGDKFGGRVKGTWDSNGNGWLGSTILAVQPLENLEILGAFNYRQSQDKTDGHGDKLNDTDFSSLNGLAKVRYTFGENADQSVFASYQRWSSDEDNQNYDQTAWGTGFGTVDRTVTDQTAIVGYENFFFGNDLLDFKAQVSWSDTLVKQDNQDPVCFSPTRCVYPFGLSAEYQYKTWQAKADNTATFQLSDSWMAYLTTGIDGQYQERLNPRTWSNGTANGSGAHPEGETTLVGGYAQAELAWNDRVSIIPGARVDYSRLHVGSAQVYNSGTGRFNTINLDRTETKVAFSPKLAALVKMSDWFGVFGSVARTERMPTLDEVFNNYMVNDVEKEVSTNFELGFTVSFNDVIHDGDGFQLKTTAFRNSIDDYYASFWDGSQVQTDVIPEALYEGVELEAAYASEAWYGSLGASLVRGRNETSGGNLNAVPADSVFMKLGYVYQPWDLDFGWRGDFFATQDRAGANESQTAGYALHNLYAAWTPEEGRFANSELRFNVDNIFDKSYRNHLATNEGTGRTFKLSFSQRF
ncbi:TonB-dependent heme/hemoglobin receptor family protein [Roseibium aquae]|uniref:TonB-dependent heme/hemoglobin receptor family protein n=1 Tax=Roseibium aquae TaxID=1323746 RepID=A0A916X276_9HYPH|nr:TonB-dependent receptor [Roseibium aquae]GGB60254.1 TonB-dependent heme/hemoglobin receptor family protein [Roseibium aquae]